MLAAAPILALALALGESKKLDVIPADLRVDESPAFSADGTRWAYAAVRGSESLIVLDGKPQATSTFADSVVFSADGRHVAWRQGRRNGTTSETWWIVLDGKAQKSCDFAGEPALSADGSRLAYWCGEGVKLDADGIYTGGRYVVMENGKAGPKFDGEEQAPRYDGVRLGYVGRRGAGWVAVAAGKESKAYPTVGPPAFSADGKHHAYAARSAERCVLLDEKGKERATGASIAAVTFSPDGRLCWAESKDGKWTMVVDGARQPGEFDAIGIAHFRPDGSRLAYRANRGGKTTLPDPALAAATPDQGVEGGKWGIVIEGKIGIEFDSAGEPVFSPKGAPLAYRARAGDKWMVVVGGEVGEPCDAVSDPTFSADGSEVRYGARLGNELWWKVVAVH